MLKRCLPNLSTRSTQTLWVVDAGPLLAIIDPDDINHTRCVQLMEQPNVAVVIPALVVVEVCQLAARKLGNAIEAEFVRGLADVEVEPPTPEDWLAIAELLDRYGDNPLGAVDASVAVLADRLGTDLIVTLDRRHFGVLRTPHGAPYRLLPD
jgi:uncharacterized protein